jgi:hypothetical protein
VLGALREVRERGDERESALYMGDGFHIGGALDGPGAGLLPIGYGLRH